MGALQNQRRIPRLRKFFESIYIVHSFKKFVSFFYYSKIRGNGPDTRLPRIGAYYHYLYKYYQYNNIYSILI